MPNNTYLDRAARDIIEHWRTRLGPGWDDSEVIRYLHAELNARRERA